MKNIPRLFINSNLSSGATVLLPADQMHYLTKVMRTDSFLAFNNGDEFNAVIQGSLAKILDKTNHKDPSGSWIFHFSPIKRTEDLVSGVVQLGAGVLQPVITDRTVAKHINWERIKKIIIENAEQSGRNSLPELRDPIPFSKLNKHGLVYGDERQLSITNSQSTIKNATAFLIGPEGGFSDQEFSALDTAGSIGVSLGKTILRAEVAAVALVARFAG